MTTTTEKHPFPMDNWLPESDPNSGFALWNDLQTLPYNEHKQREILSQPVVVPWSQFSLRVAQKKAIRDSLRKQGFCFWPWVISKHFKIDWHDFSQGNRGSCAGCATNHAVNAMLLTHMADGYVSKHVRLSGRILKILLEKAYFRGFPQKNNLESYESKLQRS